MRDAAGNGYDYLGSLTYTSSNAGLQLEAAAFAGGVIRAVGASQEVNYFLTDHLGSVRAIVGADGTVRERNDYYAFGAKHIRGDYPQNTNRYDFNGKEEQTTGNLRYLDYGARMYDSRIGRWFMQDPLHQYVSPYVYCGNNPVCFIDPTGLWSTIPGGYTTRDMNDISRMQNYLGAALGASAKGSGDFGMGDIDKFISSEMSSQKGGIYADRFGHHILESLGVSGRPGNWALDQGSLERVMAIQRDHALGMNGSLYNQRLSNPVIAAVYQGQSDFQMGAMAAVGGVLETAGSYTIIGGNIISTFAPSVGVPIRVGGEVMYFSGAGLTFTASVLQGNSHEAWRVVAGAATNYGIGKFAKFGAMGNTPVEAGFNLFWTPTLMMIDAVYKKNDPHKKR